MFQSLEAVGGFCRAAEEQIQKPSLIKKAPGLDKKKEKFIRIYQQERVPMSRSDPQSCPKTRRKRVIKKMSPDDTVEVHGSEWFHV